MKKVLIFSALLSLGACGTQPQLSELINDMVVLTNFDASVHFSQYATYSMPLDTVGLVSNTSTKEYIANDYSKLLTSTIKQNVESRGYTRVADPKTADLGINVFVINDLSVFQSVAYPNYYYGYPGYNYYGYSGYYGYAGGYSTFQYFEQAILVIEIVDLKNKNGNNQAKVIWSANIGDLLNTYSPTEKVKEAINQAFDQSPTLQR